MKRFIAGSYALLMIGVLTLTTSALPNPDDEASKLYKQAYELVLEKEFSKAQPLLQQIVNDYSSSSWVDDAQFWLCYSKEQLGKDRKAAFKCYETFLQDYPKSKWSDDAKQYMVRLVREMRVEGDLNESEMVYYVTRTEQLQKDQDEEVAMAALQALRMRGDEKSLATVAKLYEETESLRLRKKMIYIIGSFGQPEAREKLRDVVINEDDPELRKEALFWLSQGDVDNKLADFITSRALEDKSEVVSERSLFIISQLTPQMAQPRLAKLANDHPEEKIRAKAVFWMGQNGGEASLDALKKIAGKDRSFEVRKKALFGISQIHGEKSYSTLAALAKSMDNNELRANAVFWMGQSASSTQQVEQLRDIALNDKDRTVQEKALFAMSQVGDKRGMPYLRDIAEQHKNDELRAKAIFWLGQNADQNTIDFLTKRAMEDHSQEVQEKAVFALYQTEDKGLDAMIEIAKEHKNYNIRKKAIFWLGQSNDPRAMQALEEILYQNQGE